MLSNIQIYQYCDGYTDTLKVTARTNIFAWQYSPKKIPAGETGEIKLEYNRNKIEVSISGEL